MKTLIIALLFSSSAYAGQFVTDKEYQHDFQKATVCKQMLAGRLVWKGQEAFYIQANEFYTNESGEVSPDFANVVFLSNTKQALAPFRKACS